MESALREGTQASIFWQKTQNSYGSTLQVSGHLATCSLGLVARLATVCKVASTKIIVAMAPKMVTTCGVDILTETDSAFPLFLLRVPSLGEALGSFTSNGNSQKQQQQQKT